MPFLRAGNLTDAHSTSSNSSESQDRGGGRCKPQIIGVVQEHSSSCLRHITGASGVGCQISTRPLQPPPTLPILLSEN